MIALATLLAPVDAATVRASCVSQLVGFGIPADKWRKGGVFSTLLTVTCNVFAGFTTAVTNALNAGFLGSASGPWLVLLAFYVYGVTAQTATFGTGSYTLTNTAGGVYSYGPGQFKVQDPVSGNLFTNVGSFTLAAGTTMSPSTATFEIEALALGSIGGAAAGDITSLVTVLVGVTGTNPTAIIGLDSDTDTTVRTKCLAAIAARSYTGPTGAYYAAIFGYGNVPGAVNSVTGAPVNINRIQVVNNPSTGAVTVYVASPEGVPDPNDVIGCQTAVTAVAQPSCITATVVACTVAHFSAAFTIWTSSNVTSATTTILAASELAVDTAVSLYPIGGRTKPPSTAGFLYSSYLVGAAASVDPTIYAVDLSSWTALALSPGEVADVTSTFTVRQVPT